jgi:putative ABC transport system ATP-binding protein
VAAAYADRVVFLVDGQIVDEVHEPTADSVLDRMRNLPGGKSRTPESEVKDQDQDQGQAKDQGQQAKDRIS